MAGCLSLTAGLAVWLGAGGLWLNDEERWLVGDWAWGSGVPGPGDAARVEFHPGGTCVYREGSSEPRRFRWRASGGKLTVTRPGGLLDVITSQAPLHYEEVYAIAPDGPDRFRYRLVSTTPPICTPPGYSPAGICSRVSHGE